MQAIGVLLLAAATAGDGFGYQAPGVQPEKMAAPARRGHERRDGSPALHRRSLWPAVTAGPASGRRFTSTKSQIYFLDPDHMQIGWQTAGTNGERVYPPPQLVVPARYNFNQGYIYRLKITAHPRPAQCVALSVDRGRAEHPGDRRLPGS